MLTGRSGPWVWTVRIFRVTFLVPSWVRTWREGWGLAHGSVEGISTVRYLGCVSLWLGAQPATNLSFSFSL